MPYACCSKCGYECRLADHLAGKRIRCPKCSAVVDVQDRPAAAATGTVGSPPPSAATAADSDELYIGRLVERRGPVSASQLAVMARWKLIEVDEVLSNVDGSRRSTVREYLDWGGWPPPRVKIIPARRAAKVPPSGPPVPGAVKIRKLIRTEGPIDPGAEDEVEDPDILAGQSGTDLMPDEFRALLDRAVELERTSRTVDVGSRTGGAAPGYVPSAGARFVRRGYFSDGMNALALVSVINGIVFCLCSTAILGMFFKRLLSLCASVFIPFESTAEIIEGEPLMMAGLAFTFLCGHLLLPLWILFRNDCVIWHALAATVLGLMFGMAMKPEWTPYVFHVARGAAFLSGIALCSVAGWLAAQENRPEISGRFHAAIAVTALVTLALTAVDVRLLLSVSMRDLSPVVTGSAVHASVFVLCFLVLTVAIPVACCSFLMPEATEAVRGFMFRQFVTAVVLCVVGAAALLFLVTPQPANFLNVPLAMLPFAIASMLAVVTPPMLWLLHPDYSLPRR